MNESAENTVGEPNDEITVKIPTQELPSVGEEKVPLGADAIPGRRQRRNDTSKTVLGLYWSQIQQYISGSKNLRNVKDAETEIAKVRSRAIRRPAGFKNDTTFINVDQLYDNRSYIAEGGQGTLSLADDHALHRQVALKSLRKELQEGDEERERFIREARITAKLEHPSIVPIYNLCTDKDGGLHLAMQYLHGKSLKEMLENIHLLYLRDGADKFDEAESLAYRLSIFTRICEAISFAHSRKVIHCDLKPENIMLGEFGEVFVMDWGIARELDTPQENNQRVFGTPRYIAPEVLTGNKFDERADIYALGVILFELVALKPAFSGNVDGNIIRSVCRHEMSPLKHEYGFPISADLAAIINKATNFSIHDRYQSATELLIDVRRFIFNEEVSANPDGIFGKISRHVYRHRRGFSVWTAIFIIVGVALWSIGVFDSISKAAIRKQEQDDLVTMLSSRLSFTGVQLGRKITKLAEILAVLNSNIAMLLKDDILSDEVMPHSSGEESLRRVSATYLPLDPNAPVLSYDLKKKLNINPLDYLSVLHLTPDNTKAVRELKILFPAINLAMRTKLTGNEVFKDNAALVRAMSNDLSPIYKIYFSLVNGLDVIYPAVFDYPDDFDGRERPWYRDAMAHARSSIVWTKPYFDINTRVPVISGAMQIVSPQGKVLGVSGIDVSILYLYSQICTPPTLSGREPISRFIVDSEGRIIVEAQYLNGTWSMRELKMIDDKRIFMPEFENKALFGIMKKNGYGHYIQTTAYGETLWAYFHLLALNAYFVEESDLNDLLEYYDAFAD